MKIIKLKDDQFLDTGHNHTRIVVRGILLNEKNEVALIRIKGDDIFGHRDYYETPGGGKKRLESKIKALKRELLEEVGVEINNIKKVAKVVDFYNLIKRKNINYYYLCYVKSYKERHLEDYEKNLMASIDWIPLDKISTLYENIKDTPISILVKRRELPLLLSINDYIK